MKHFTLKMIATAIGGVVQNADPDMAVSAVTIDSRKAAPGTLFFAIKGERFDGHDFIPQAAAAGAVCVSSRPTEHPAILVRDTLNAFRDGAEFYRSLFDIPVIGITGSVGKTTTKEMLASALGAAMNVHKNMGNLNNQTGVPMTVFAMDEGHEVAIVEMGTNHFGEVRALSKIGRPNICVLTNIGEAHIEFLGSKEGILKAKSEMMEFMDPNGLIVVNGDDPLLATLRGKYPRLVTCGIGRGNMIYAKDIETMGLKGTAFTACSADFEVRTAVHAPGMHMVGNALAAFAVGRELGIAAETIAKGIEAFSAGSGRLNIVDAPLCTVIDDAYNANPTSMAASLGVLGMADTRRVAIIGDMYELGDATEEAHRRMGECAAKNADLVLAVGRLSKPIEQAASQAGAKAMYFADKAALIEALPSLIEKGDTVLVKASNSLGLGEAAKMLIEMK